MLNDNRKERAALVQIFHCIDFQHLNVARANNVSTQNGCEMHANMSSHDFRIAFNDEFLQYLRDKISFMINKFHFESKKISSTRKGFLSEFIIDMIKSIDEIDGHIIDVIQDNYRAKLCYPHLFRANDLLYREVDNALLHDANKDNNAIQNMNSKNINKEPTDVDYYLLRSIMRACTFELFRYLSSDEYRLSLDCSIYDGLEIQKSTDNNESFEKDKDGRSKIIQIISGYLFLSKQLNCSLEIKFLNAVLEKIARKMYPPHLFKRSTLEQ